MRAYNRLLRQFEQGGQDSNLQPAVLETAALPIEPPPFEALTSGVRVASHVSTPPLPPKPVGFRGANNYTLAGAELTLNHADALVQLQNAIFFRKRLSILSFGGILSPAMPRIL